VKKYIDMTSPFVKNHKMQKTKVINHLPKIREEQFRKHVAAIHTSGDLSLLERKMVNVLLLNAYDDLLFKRTHTLPVTHLKAMIGWEESYNITLLKKVLTKLATTPIEFNVMEDGRESWRVMSMISFGEIKGGVCTYRYDEYLAERLFDPEIYAMINLSVQRKFEAGYALTLYENCVRYKTVGSTGWWDLVRFRKLLGANAQVYEEFKYLKREVITKSIKEINRVSDITIEAEYKRTARKISQIRFLISDNQQKSLFKPVIDDDHEKVKKSDTFKRLREHGIGERLAIAWILQDKDKAQKVIEYVEEKDKKKLIKGTTAGYIRKLIEDDAEVGKSEYEIKKEQKEKDDQVREKRRKLADKKAELESEYKKNVISEQIKNLSLAKTAFYVQQYSIGEGKGRVNSFNPSTGIFSDSIERVSFTGWLRSQLLIEVKIEKEEFNQWLKEKSGLA